MRNTDVAIIGAGPYGLSIAAHLKHLGVQFRIVGHPMHTWLNHMPKGMHLKSEGFASCLYDPESKFTLETYCKEKGIPYGKLGKPVPLDVFSAYGLEFQKRFVPQLEDQLATAVEKTPDGFRVVLEDGTSFLSRKVVLAVGLTHYDSVPPLFSGIPERFASHSSKHSAVDKFSGKDVVVIGGGASAVDLAALLYQVGARVNVLARKSRFRFHDPPANFDPSLLDQLRNPITGIGPGWELFFYSNAPLLFRLLPVETRLERVRKVLGPAPCWFTKEQVVGKVQLHVSTTVTSAKVENGKVSLQIVDGQGQESALVADHVIAATGYKVSLKRLEFLNEELRSKIHSVEDTPILSSNFESSIPGLYFVGVSAANSFGPLLRFAFGAGFTSKRLANHLAKLKQSPQLTKSEHSSVETEEPDEVNVR